MGDFIDTSLTLESPMESLLQRLPSDIPCYIMTEYLQLKEILCLSETSHYFYNKICQQEWLWKYLYCRDISSLRTPLNWRTEYIKVMVAIKGKSSDQILDEATRNGYERFIEFQIAKRIRISKAQADRIMILAAKGGYHDIVEMMIMADARNFNEAMR